MSETVQPEQSAQSNKPKGIPFTFLPAESQVGNMEVRKGEPYQPEVYNRVVHNLEQIYFDATNRQEFTEIERGFNNSLFMTSLGLQAIAYDHLGPEGQVNFKDYLFSVIKNQDWKAQPVGRTMRLWKNNPTTPLKG